MRELVRSCLELWRRYWWSAFVYAILFYLGTLPGVRDSLKHHLGEHSAWVRFAAFLLDYPGWFGGAVLVGVLFHAYHVERMKAKAAHTALRGPTLDPQQVLLLSIVQQQQREVGKHKLTMLRDGTVTPTGFNVANRILGPGRAEQFETLMDTMPPEYLQRIPDAHPEARISVRITPAGFAYLESTGISASLIDARTTHQGKDKPSS